MHWVDIIRGETMDKWKTLSLIDQLGSHWRWGLDKFPSLSNRMTINFWIHRTTIPIQMKPLKTKSVDFIGAASMPFTTNYGRIVPLIGGRHVTRYNVNGFLHHSDCIFGKVFDSAQKCRTFILSVALRILCWLLVLSPVDGSWLFHKLQTNARHKQVPHSKF